MYLETIVGEKGEEGLEFYRANGVCFRGKSSKWDSDAALHAVLEQSLEGAEKLSGK